MNFFTQLMPIFVGSFMGFIFAIGVFYITENIKKGITKRNLIKNLKNEFLYNIEYINSWIENTVEILNNISKGKRDCSCHQEFTKYQSYFLNKAFQSGILFELFNNVEIKGLIVIMSRYGTYYEDSINQSFKSWQSEDLKTEMAFEIFRASLQLLQIHKTSLEKIVPKIKTKQSK